MHDFYRRMKSNAKLERVCQWERMKYDRLDADDSLNMGDHETDRYKTLFTGGLTHKRKASPVKKNS